MGSKKNEGPAKASIRLRQVRTALGLKHREMGALLGVPRQDHYKHFEGRTRPTREIVAAIEKQLGLPASAFLSDESIPDADFNHLVSDLRDRALRDGSILMPRSQTPLHTDTRRDVGSHIPEGVLGQSSIDFILGTLNEIKEQVAANSRAIQEIQKAKKPGFRKGRS